MKGRILIVDDNAAGLKLTTHLLTHHGHDIYAASDVEGALAIIRDQKPQLILTDLELPDGDGLDITRRVKAEKETRDIVVVAFTAYASKADEERATRAGCDGFLSKPLEMRELLDAVEHFLEQAAQRQR